MNGDLILSGLAQDGETPVKYKVSRQDFEGTWKVSEGLFSIMVRSADVL